MSNVIFNYDPDFGYQPVNRTAEIMESFNRNPWEVRIAISVMIPLGLICNFVVMLVNANSSSSSKFFWVCLRFMMVLHCLILVGFGIIISLPELSREYLFNILPKIDRFVFLVCECLAMASNYTLLILSLERSVVAKRMLRQTGCCCNTLLTFMVLVAILGSVAYAVPQLMKEYFKATGKTHLVNHKDTLSTIFFSNVMLYVIVFLVPVIITIIFNVVNISIVSNISRGTKDQNRKQVGLFNICKWLCLLATLTSIPILVLFMLELLYELSILGDYVGYQNVRDILYPVENVCMVTYASFGIALSYLCR